jgi:hypothetical protein
LSLHGLKVIFLDAPEVAKVLPERPQIHTRTEREFMRFQRFQKVSG